MHPTPVRTLVAGLSLALILGCTSTSGPAGDDADDAIEITCSIPTDEIFRGAPRDGIPALTDPDLVRPETPGSSLWADGDRVVGVVLGGQPIAVPINVLWWHEVVNLDRDGTSIALTHCPLTGSSLAFDRAVVGGDAFGVSGLLYRNNLLMYERTDGVVSLWPQMARGARCGPRDGTALSMVPVIEMTYGGWTRLHPSTLVVSSATGWDRDYRNYPYFDYDREDNDQLLYPVRPALDRRRPPKERVLGVPAGDGGRAWPYGLLREQGDLAVLEQEVAGESLVVFWDAEVESAMAFRPIGPDGEALTFRVEGELIVDDQSGSEWSVTGAVSGGPLLGYTLEPVAEAFIAFWFAWPLFYPEIELWEGAT